MTIWILLTFGTGIIVGMGIAVLIGMFVNQMRFPKSMISGVLEKLTEEELAKQTGKGVTDQHATTTK